MKSIVLGHKLERDELLRQKFIPREGVEYALKSLENAQKGREIRKRSGFNLVLLTGKQLSG